MPVAQRSINEDSHQFGAGGDDLMPILHPKVDPPKLDLTIFEQIRESLDKIKSCKDGASEDMRKLEKLSKYIEAAEEMIHKAEEKRDALLRKNNFLKSKYDKFVERRSEAIKYWQEYGLDVREISTDNYEFIFTKLPDKELLQPITIGLKLQDNQLKIVSRSPPAALTEEQIQELDSKMASSCSAQSNGEHVDYKLAMILIRKILIKNPAL